MITVGIHENLVVAAATKNDKKTLIITIKEADEVDPLAALNTAGSTQFEKAKKDFMIYPPSVNAFSGGVDTFENILKKIAEIKDPLNHILQQYLTNSNIKWDIFAGVGVTKDNLADKVQNQENLDKIYGNIVDQFIKMITPHVGDNSKKLRFMFIRQSKAKHFPTFRKRFLETYPFVEPMDVPTSKLKFSQFEIDNGLASADAVTNSQTVSNEEKAQVDSLFTAN